MRVDIEMSARGGLNVQPQIDLQDIGPAVPEVKARMKTRYRRVLRLELSLRRAFAMIGDRCREPTWGLACPFEQLF